MYNHSIIQQHFSFFSLIDSLERKHSSGREEIAELRATIKSMDREKDELQQQVDEKTEDIMSLEAIKITLVIIIYYLFNTFKLL
jgi:chromosome segregation ATPase